MLMRPDSHIQVTYHAILFRWREVMDDLAAVKVIFRIEACSWPDGIR